jgi:hypothetical protein
MHKTSKAMSLLLAAFLAFSLLSAFATIASSGNILVGVTEPPSPVISVKLGGNVSLYFGRVTWSGGTIDLYLSTNGYSSLSSSDFAFGQTFFVAKLEASEVDTMSYPGYSVGYNWINGTIPETLEFPGGNYYIKAFDGSTSAVAVTDNYITIICSLEVTPPSGPGGASIQLKGYAYPPNSYVNLSYLAGNNRSWETIDDFVNTDQKGMFTYNVIALDLGRVMAATGPAQTSQILFKAISPLGEDEAVFSEYWRGLVQVDGRTAAEGILFGNNTNFVEMGVQLEFYDLLIVAGQYFHPGVVYVLWDNATLINTMLADATGFFNTSFFIPVGAMGYHNVTIEDASTTFAFIVPVFQKDYNLTVHVQTKFGLKPIQGVEVEVYVYGLLLGKSITDANGNTIFQGPDGTYTIVAKQHLFWNIYIVQEQTVTITKDTTVAFTFLF